jgi:hypothetical protein
VFAHRGRLPARTLRRRRSRRPPRSRRREGPERPPGALPVRISRLTTCGGALVGSRSPPRTGHPPWPAPNAFKQRGQFVLSRAGQRGCALLV